MHKNNAFSNNVGKEQFTVPHIEVTGGTDLPGDFYLSFISVPAVIQIGGNGEIKKEIKEAKDIVPISDHHPILTDRDWPDGRGWWDFKKSLDSKNEVYYSYHAAEAKSNKAANDYGVSGYHPGIRVIMDKNFEVIKELRLSADTDYGVSEGDYVDGHDFLMFDIDHYILSSYRLDEESNLVYSYLQEVENGEVKWRWASINYSKLQELTKQYPDTDKALPDYVHFNSMCVDPTDDNLICSFRHINTIIKISRDRTLEKDKQIIWKLSGDQDEFGLEEAFKTCYQHYVRFDGKDAITCFDNRNDDHLTRIVTYFFDEDHKKCLSVKTQRIDGKYSSACGSVQHIKDDIYVIGWGKAEYDAHETMRDCMTVYDFAKKKALMTVKVDCLKGYVFTYRCVYFD